MLRRWMCRVLSRRASDNAGRARRQEQRATRSRGLRASPPRPRAVSSRFAWFGGPRLIFPELLLYKQAERVHQCRQCTIDTTLECVHGIQKYVSHPQRPRPGDCATTTATTSSASEPSGGVTSSTGIRVQYSVSQLSASPSGVARTACHHVQGPGPPGGRHPGGRARAGAWGL
jgi:hypothetical protein